MFRHASFNRIYRLVWSSVGNRWVAVAENAHRHGKTRNVTLTGVASLLCAALAQAAPAGGQVVGGSGSISQSGSTTTVQQNSQSLSVNWQSFNVGRQETVNFVQPSAAAIAVNRIFDTAGSQILGKINANGQVWLINPNGVLFGQGAQVNVGGLVASTLDLGNASGDGKTASFAGSGSGSVINRGDLNATTGGYIALLGKSVTNDGTITAPQGTVALGAGSTVTLNFNGNSLASLQVEQSLLDALAANGGLIRANGGQVLLSAGARDSLVASVVNNTGVIEARTLENQAGNIVLLAGMSAGTTQVGGTLDASAPDGGNGGFIETSGARVKVADDAKITTLAANGQTGRWLIDPTDYTVAASGGDMSGWVLGQSLMASNVSVKSSEGASGSAGNVNINDSVSWDRNTLTLDAVKDININAALYASGTAGLALKYGQGAVASGNTSTYKVNAPVNLAATGSFSTRLGSDGAVKTYAIINDVYALQGISGLYNNYVLGANIDASVTASWNGSAGFVPLGGNSSYKGDFDGLGHTVSGLTINRPGTSYVGLFGAVDGRIRNLGLVSLNVKGDGAVGGLAGRNYGEISGCYVSGTVSGGGSVGGLVGQHWGGSIDASHASGSVTGTGSWVGGLVGLSGVIDNSGLPVPVSIRNSYATSQVNGAGAAGGLVGKSATGSISTSFASGSVTGTGYRIGGLVGENEASISASYASGSVRGYDYAGGLVGENQGNVSNSYASGSVTGTGANADLGGLVGLNQGGISTSYSSGRVVGSGNLGGLVGRRIGGRVDTSYWNKTTSGQASSAGGTGLTAGQMMQSASFAGWDNAVWKFYDGHSAPLLKSFLTPLTVTIASGSRVYDGTTATSLGVSYSATPNANLLGRGNLVVSAADKNVGEQALSASGLYSNQQGYDISYVGGTLTISAKPISGTITAADKAYDGTLVATTSGRLSGVIAGDRVAFNTSGRFADGSEGPAKTVNVSGSLSGADAGNYTLTTNTTATATITPPVPVAPPAPSASVAAVTSGALTPITTQLVSGLVNTTATFGNSAASAGQTLSGRLTVSADGTPATTATWVPQAQAETGTQSGGTAEAADSALSSHTALAAAGRGPGAPGTILRIEDGGLRLPEERQHLN